MTVRTAGTGSHAPAPARLATLALALLCIGSAASITASHDWDAWEYAQLALARDDPAPENGTGIDGHLPAAWLRVDGTGIDLPVAALEDTAPDDYYLTHDLWGERSSLGCPFMDRHSLPGSRHIMVFGHRVGWTNQMFTPLWNSYEQHRFDELGNAVWEMPGVEAERLHPLCAMRVDAYFAPIQRFSWDSDDAFRTWLVELAEAASARSSEWEVLVEDAERALTLVTCAEANGRSSTRTIVIFVAGEEERAHRSESTEP